jgi:hypothetical protein
VPTSSRENVNYQGCPNPGGPIPHTLLDLARSASLWPSALTGKQGPGTRRPTSAAIAGNLLFRDEGKVCPAPLTDSTLAPQNLERRADTGSHGLSRESASVATSPQQSRGAATRGLRQPPNRLCSGERQLPPRLPFGVAQICPLGEPRRFERSLSSGVAGALLCCGDRAAVAALSPLGSRALELVPK